MRQVLRNQRKMRTRNNLRPLRTVQKIGSVLFHRPASQAYGQEGASGEGIGP